MNTFNYVMLKNSITYKYHVDDHGDLDGHGDHLKVLE